MREKKQTVARCIDRTTARMLASVLMGCYRRGVNDAREHRDDEGMLRDHIRETLAGERWGFADQKARSVTYWKNRIGEVAEECGYVRAWCKFCERMGREWSNYLSVTLVMAQEMYCKGIGDYLDNPGDDLTAFNSGSVRTLWTEKGARSIDVYRLRTMVQDWCAIRGERAEEGEPEPMRKSRYDIFSTAFAYAVVAR